MRRDPYENLKRAWGKPDRFERGVTLGVGCAFALTIVFVLALLAAVVLGVIWLAGVVL